MEEIWDPLRKKQVPLTPEERVRQWFIARLHTEAGIPFHMMASEVPLRYGQKEYRADIVVWSRRLKPAMVVECKRPEVDLTREVLEQALNYNRVLESPYLAITNGTRTYLARKEGQTMTFVSTWPKYEELCQL